jgi:hypothetical protein
MQHSIREHLHHDQIFGRTGEQAHLAAKVEGGGALDTAQFEIDGANRDVDGCAVRRALPRSLRRGAQGRSAPLYCWFRKWVRCAGAAG